MLKRDYFKLAMDNDCYRSLAWIIAAFSVAVEQSAPRLNPFVDPGELVADKLRVKRDDQGNPYFNDLETDQVVYIDDYSHGSNGELVPLFAFKEAITLNAGDCINLNVRANTSYGAWLYNQIMCVYPFGNKIPFAEKGYLPKELEKIIEKRWVNDSPAEGENAARLLEQTDPYKQPITVDEHIRYSEAAGSLSGLTQLCVPSATPYTMSVSPELIKRRDELFEQYKDRLKDPAIQARISEELIKMDKEWIAQDPDKGFYYQDKSFDVVRKKLFMFIGAESGFGVEGDFIPRSLDEGITPDDLPAMANASRSGSFSRGALTALGGESTKFSLRMFQNSTVVDGDCGSVLGKPMILTQSKKNGYLGNYVLVNQKPVLLTEENFGAFMDKMVVLRSPIFCHTPGANFCSICVGAKISQAKEALATFAGDIGSIFMLLSMKAMHGKKLSTTKYEFEIAIT